jgi:hypothetical protein
MTSIDIQPQNPNPNEIENLINALNPLPFPDAKSNIFIVDSIVLTLTLLRYQSHSWAHHKILFQEVRIDTFYNCVPLCFLPINHFSESGQCQFHDHSTMSN